MMHFFYNRKIQIVTEIKLTFDDSTKIPNYEVRNLILLLVKEIFRDNLNSTALNEVKDTRNKLP